MFSIWEKETFFSHQDIVIVGSGFVGLWSALFLCKYHPDRKITVLERGLIPSGASSRNAGFACFGSPSELIRDGREMGTDKMLELVEMRYRGLRRIQKYFSNQTIDFDLCGGYELYEHGKVAADELQSNIEYLNSLLRPITDTKNTYSLVNDRIDAFGFAATEHLVLNKEEGYQHSGKLLQALLQKVQSKGVQVLTGVEVTHIDAIRQHPILHTHQNFSVSADQVLLCTNAFTRQIVSDIDVVPARGQVLVTSPIENLPFRGTFHSDEGFYYFRNLGDRVLLGGARNKAFDAEATTDMTTSDFIQQELERYLSEVILPGRTDYRIEHRWAGIMAFGSEKLPIIKQLDENLYCAVRMSGMGVALAPIVGQQVAKMMA